MMQTATLARKPTPPALAETLLDPVEIATAERDARAARRADLFAALQSLRLSQDYPADFRAHLLIAVHGATVCIAAGDKPRCEITCRTATGSADTLEDALHFWEVHARYLVREVL